MDANSEIEKLREKLATAERELSLANARYDELQHRLRNEFQAFLAFYTVRSRMAQPTDFCHPCIARMWSAVALHTALEEPSHSMCMSDYIQSLSRAFQAAFDGSLSFKMHICPEIILGHQQAQILGQIFCEAAMNAVKHAFPNAKRGQVVTSLEQINDEFQFIISNDGTDFDPDKVKPGSFHAITDLAKQLGGEARAQALPKGMQLNVTFPTGEPTKWKTGRARRERRAS